MKQGFFLFAFSDYPSYPYIIMINKKTILIYGISSFVGSNLAEFLSKDFRIVGTYHRTKVRLDGILTIPCDVLQKEEVQLTLYAFKPDIVIYAAGLSSVLDCNEASDYADALNTVGLFNVADNCQRYKSKVIYLSSQYVFGGEKKIYREMDIPDPHTTYGKTKASAEFYLQKNSLNYLIFRLCPLYGRSINPFQQTFFEKLERDLYVGKSFTADNNVSNGFLDIYFFAMLLKICIENDEQNRLFQVSSSDQVSHYEFAKIYARTFGYPESAISKTKWPLPLLDLPPSIDSSDVKLNYDLDIINIESTVGLEIPTVESSLEFTFKRFRGHKSKKRLKQGGGVSFI
jgi:dTDP-4-dehydrorhamnose reductase